MKLIIKFSPREKRIEGEIRSWWDFAADVGTGLLLIILLALIYILLVVVVNPTGHL